MDFLKCKVYNVPYDEEEHRPHHAPCGHEICLSCIKTLIQECVFECPNCRQKNKVVVPDDLPVSFGLIDVIRAFNTQKVSLSKQSQPGSSGVNKNDLCKVHFKSIRH